jgi:RNA polymerase sigma-70 factor, ECF subfamily
MTMSSVQSVVQFPAGLESVMLDLYEKSRGEDFGLSREQFVAILREVAAKYMPSGTLSGGANHRKLAEFLRSLRVEDLVLARACGFGSERAWDVFLLRYRGKLYDIAAYITKESSAARDLADSLYADLYGTTVQDGKRVSKLASYTGRGSLEGWLRAVMGQEYINRYRRQRILVSLEEKSEGGTQFAAPDPPPAARVDPQVEAATAGALAGLSAEDRFLLASYYLDNRTLADIARLLGVHESTVSRKLDKIAKSLRKRIVAALVGQGMSHRQAEEAMEIDVRDLQVNVKSLTQKVKAQSFPEEEIQAQTGDGTG